MRSRFAILAAAVFVVLFALLGYAMATAAQSGVQPVSSLAGQEPPVLAGDTTQVYLPLIWAEGTDQDALQPAGEPGQAGGEDAAGATPTPLPVPTLSAPTEVVTGTQPMADLSVLDHCGAIAANETWVSGYVHRVTRNGRRAEVIG